MLLFQKHKNNRQTWTLGLEHSVTNLLHPEGGKWFPWKLFRGCSLERPRLTLAFVAVEEISNWWSVKRRKENGTGGSSSTWTEICREGFFSYFLSSENYYEYCETGLFSCSCRVCLGAERSLCSSFSCLDSLLSCQKTQPGGVGCKGCSLTAILPTTPNKHTVLFSENKYKAYCPHSIILKPSSPQINEPRE